MANTPGPRGWCHEFLVFGFKRGWACLFGGLMLALLLGTHLFWPTDAPLHRYDAITIGAVLIQLAMLAFRLETPKEALVILIFHRSEEHTSELQSLMRLSYAVFCLKKKKKVYKPSQS